MAYEVRKSDGTLITTIEDGTLDRDSTSIGFIGKRFADYGLVYNENQLHLLEHFANTTPPTNPITGQIWFDSTPGINALNVFINETIGWRLLTFSEDLTNSQINNNVNFNNSVTFNSDSVSNSLFTFSGPVNFEDEINFNTSNIEGSPTFFGSPVFQGTVTFDGSVVFNNTFNFTELANFENNVEMFQNLNVAQDISGDNLTLTGGITSSGLLTTSEEFSGDGIRLNELTLRPELFENTATVYGRNQRGNDLLTVLFLQFNEANGATTVEDSAFGVVANGGPNPNNSITLTGAAAVTTFAGKFGGSLELNGTTDYVQIADNTNYDFGIQTLTMDMWFRTTSASTEQALISKGASATDNWTIFVNATNELAFNWSDGVTTVSISGGNINTYDWNHVALIRLNETPAAGQSTFILFLNGDQVASSVQTLTDVDFDTITGDVNIGRRNYGTFEYFAGNLDQIRLVKGNAKYTSSFQPRTSDVRSETIPFFTNFQGAEWRLIFEPNSW